MKKTKQNILQAALKLFNRDGFVNVRLQHIADEAFISVGNLAYHYRNKEAITFALYEELTHQQQELLMKYRVVPLFINIDLLLQHTFHLQQAYVFFYLDTLEIVRAYPAIATSHQNHIASQITQLKSILDFNRSRGAFQQKLEKNAVGKLAEQIWMTMDLWLTQQSIRSKNTTVESDFKLAVWSLLMPHFTETGQMEYQQMLLLPDDLFF